MITSKNKTEPEIGNRSKKNRINIAKLLQEAFEETIKEIKLKEKRRI